MTWCKASGNPDKWTHDCENNLCTPALKKWNFLANICCYSGSWCSIFEIFAFDIAGLCYFFLSKQVYMIFGPSGFIHNALGRQHNYFERHEKNKASTKILVSEIHPYVGLAGTRTNVTSLNFGNVFCIFFLTSISHCAYCLALKLCCLIKFSLSIYVVSK